MYAGPHSNYFKEDYLILFHCLLEDRIFVSFLHILLLIKVIKHQLQGQKNKRAAQLYTWIRKSPTGFLLYSVYLNDIQTPLLSGSTSPSPGTEFNSIPLLKPKRGQII